MNQPTEKEIEGKNELLQKQKELEQKSKVCNSCLIEKNIEFFYKKKGCKFGVKGTCKKCTYIKWGYNKEYGKKRREENKEYIKIYKSSNHHKKLKIQHEKRYVEKIRKTNPSVYIGRGMRSRISSLIKGKNRKTFDILGYNQDELRNHLESLFLEGMNWDNYGKYGWHIDHIKPLVMYDCSTENGIKEAFRLENLKPLRAKDNLSKGSLYEGERKRARNGMRKGKSVSAPRVGTRK